VRSETARPREAHARTIEVRGSHTGMIVNADVYRELARLLSATDGDADLL